METIEAILKLEGLRDGEFVKIKDRLNDREFLITREHGIFKMIRDTDVLFFTACKMGLYDRINLFMEDNEIARITVVTWEVVE